MDPNAMMPYGRALLDYSRGDITATLVVRRDDGFETPLPVSHFFRQTGEFSPIEAAALHRCQGRVLDIGAGSGLHSLVMQAKGLKVTAIDISPQAVEIMVQRGVRDARRADIFQFRGGPFDTLLMLGHGIGMVEDLEGLDRFLVVARELTREDARLLLDSLDVRRTDDPTHLAYHETNRRAGRYIGEIRNQLEYRGEAGPYSGWLHIGPQALEERAERRGWKCEVVLEQENGEYLACLTQERTADPAPEGSSDAE